ncbi:uncharacterized protein BT62DRAFT_1071544 [Guyanagaster necrorhizus]|uniref:Uncharacterized protein n=1 Tax=Guyanagaster necrorhizus TaxID=856835 RepID=A0A9P7W5A9_9AGAR|nr:uncharacterized protein BT62DRAFT_1071544 [Guyanagaster necrorhizus MCA 3950]KAG7452408.1 hypothetical protein BT62DRAFT_1071544 [Guyanagaster necrorhizus MCA 3950]
MPKDSSRRPLPTSSVDFALPPSSVASTSSHTSDESALMHRIRRPSILAPKASFLSDARLSSPLATSFTLHSSSRHKNTHHDSPSDLSDGSSGAIRTDSSSSGDTTPSIGIEDDATQETKILRPYLSSPRRLSSSMADAQDSRPYPRRRLSFPPKQPRILNLLAESRPVENEVKSEAAFQRLVASGAELPLQPHIPRSASDRGRYPEEAGHDDFQREDTPSDDEDYGPFAYTPSSHSDPINIVNRRKNASGEDLDISESSSLMDVDAPSCSPMSTSSMTQWRYTPPPTTSAVRSAKRKFDDRFDPYPASKRRAVSPSIPHLRDPHSTLGSPRGSNRIPIAIPVSIPSSNVNSTTSSPTISGSYPRSMSITSSPTLRASMGLSSPIIRPVPRTRRFDGEDREVDGAGEAVGGLSLG